jgi:hypothetical protein
MKQPILRPAIDVQRAHDLVSGFLLNEELPREKTVDALLSAALNVLCWVLGHEDNPAFANNLVRLEAAMGAAGFELIDSGELVDPREEAS